MSCKHGNHESACDICDEVSAAYESGLAARLAAPAVANAAPAGELPPLPERDGDWAGDDWFTADSMRDYARAAIAALPKPVVAMTEDAARWQFMMRIADDEDGPESKAMESLKLASEMMESDRPASVQMVEMVDQARAALAAHAGQGAKA